MHCIKNDHLTVKVQIEGAEITSITDRSSGKEYIWQADPKVWGSSAPVLFPIIGGLKNDQYIFKGHTYTVPKHGFIRRNPNLVPNQPDHQTLVFTYASSPVLKQNYPFDFIFKVEYRLEGRKLRQTHRVTNTGNAPLYFSLGGHTAFKVPVNGDEAYDDYYLDFEHHENSASHTVVDGGLIGPDTRPVPWNGSQLPLTHELFENDALIFKDLKSKSVELVSKKNGKVLGFHYEDFDYFAVWAKPNGDFVCLEPWLGIADNHDTDGNLKTKEGIIELANGETFTASFSVEIF
ncbi:aldose epimerase [Lewinellaceae bacterium SD302]|nr:aldose epimerase [Lewinellaceae bacterium SD302]